MSDPTSPPPRSESFDSEGAYLLAVDTLLLGAQREVRLFDRDLTRLKLDRPQRIEQLTRFLAAGPSQRLCIVLHDTGPAEREQPRLLNLLRRFSPAIEFRQSPENLRHLADGLLLADKQSGVIRFHADHARGKSLHHAPAEVHPYWQRFGELWDLSEPCLTATVLGL